MSVLWTRALESDNDVGVTIEVGLTMQKDKLQSAACQAVREKITTFEQGGLPREVSEQYCKAYGLEIGDAQMKFFTIDTTDCNTICYIFKPQNPKACVILVHGYLDHSMAWRNIVPCLLKDGYMVLLYDMKGHGLSDGARADIGDFGEYRRQMEQVLEFAARFGLRLHAIAHSTGAGVLADLLLNDKKHAEMISSSALIAPLLHSAHWGVSRMAVGILPLTSVKRSFRKNSSDSSFMKFQKADPLQYDKIPISWMNANTAWAKRMLASVSVYDDDNVLFIQGAKDAVVDWKFNMKFYGQRFPHAKKIMYENGRHQLMNESQQMIDELGDDLLKWIDIEREGI